MDTRWTYSNIWLRNAMMLAFLFAFFVTAQYFDQTEAITVESIFVEIIGILALVYTFIFIHNTAIVKPLLLDKKYKEFFLCSVLFWALFIVFADSINMYKNEQETLANKIGSGVFIAFIGTGIYFIHLWIYQNVLSTQKKLLSTEAELQVLKLQLNPHFLLNALNNLYGVALTNPQDTPERILELSELLRYQIESTKKNCVYVFQEVDFIKKYVSYHQFKSNGLIVSATYSGVFNKHFVPPLLFIMLVENALKFASQTAQARVSMNLTLLDDDLMFSIENSCLGDSERMEGTKLGLENLTRRLEVSEIKHKMNISSQQEKFKVVLYLWQLPTTVL